MLEGIIEMAEDALDAPVRRGAPGEIEGLADAVCTPLYSTAVGLTLYGAEQREHPVPGGTNPYFFARMTDMVRGWLSELF